MEEACFVDSPPPRPYEGTSCAFTRLIQDPGFQEEVNTGFWADDGGKGATVLPMAVGGRDRAEGALDNSAICNAGGLLQAVEMPSDDFAEPFVVEVDYKAQAVHGLALGFNRSWKRLPPTESPWRTETFCLGEGGYGESPNSEVQVRISASERLANCYLSFSLPDVGSTEVELVIDDVEITTDPDCGTDEDLLDPSFESAPAFRRNGRADDFFLGTSPSCAPQ